MDRAASGDAASSSRNEACCEPTNRTSAIDYILLQVLSSVVSALARHFGRRRHATPSLTSGTSRLVDTLNMTGPVRFDNALVVGYPSTSTFTIHVANQRVEAITPSTDLAPSISVDEVVDLEGKAWLGPSLVDAHVHFTTWSLTRMRLDLTHAVTACEVVELVSLEASKPTEDPLAPIIGRD